MNAILLTCVKCTASKNGGYRLTLQSPGSESVITPFGKVEGSQGKKYAMKTDTECAVGTKGELDLDQFDIRDDEFTVEDESDANFGKTFPIHWLNPKKSQ